MPVDVAAWQCQGPGGARGAVGAAGAHPSAVSVGSSVSDTRQAGAAVPLVVWGWGQCGCGVRLGYAHGLLLCSSCWCGFGEWGVPEVRGCCPSCWALTTNPLRAGFATLGS